jgi:hypothetical protein
LVNPARPPVACDEHRDLLAAGADRDLHESIVDTGKITEE